MNISYFRPSATRVIRQPFPRSSARERGKEGEPALQPKLLPALAQGAQPQRVEPDEAGGVAVVVGDGAFLERDEILVIERAGTFASDHGDVTLVEFEPHLAPDEFLAAVDRGLQHFAFRRE